jgi:DNA-binding response OmpR family regulator
LPDSPFESDSVEIHIASTEKEAERQLNAETFDLVISGLHLPRRVGMQGLVIVSKTQKRNHHRFIEKAESSMCRRSS